MRKPETLVIGLAALLAIAVMAAPAQAEENAEFSAGEGAEMVDLSTGAPTFTVPILPSNPLTCTTASAKAGYVEQEPELTASEIAYSSCHTVILGITFPVTVDTNGCHFTFTAGTYTDIGSGLAHGSLHIGGCAPEKPDSLTITVFEPGGKSPYCTFHVPEQTIEGITYHNTTDEGVMAIEGTAKELDVDTTITDDNETTCDEEKTVDSSYTGNFIAKATDENEEYVDATVNAPPVDESADFWAAEGATEIDATGGKSTFVFGGKELTCPAVTGSAKYTEEGGPTLTGENIRYGDANHTCHVIVFGITFPITIDENNCHFTFHAGTYTATEGLSHGSVTIENCESDSMTMTIWAPGSHPSPEPAECTMHIPEQTIDGITYDNVTTESDVMAVEITLNDAQVTTTQTKTGSPDVSVGHVTVTLPGSGGHNPPSFSIAREISA